MEISQVTRKVSAWSRGAARQESGDPAEGIEARTTLSVRAGSSLQLCASRRCDSCFSFSSSSLSLFLLLSVAVRWFSGLGRRAEEAGTQANSVNAVQSGAMHTGVCDAQERERRRSRKEEWASSFLAAQRPTSSSTFTTGRRLQENGLPWRLTPICHCSSITEHPAAAAAAVDYHGCSPPPSLSSQPASLPLGTRRHAATPGRRANKTLGKVFNYADHSF